MVVGRKLHDVRGSVCVWSWGLGRRSSPWSQSFPCRLGRWAGCSSNQTALRVCCLVASQLSTLCLCVCCRRLSGHKPFPFFFLPTRRPRYAINLLQGPVGLELWPAFSLNSAIFCRGLLLGLHAGSRYRLIVRTLTCYAIRYYLSHSPCSPSSH